MSQLALIQAPTRILKQPDVKFVGVKRTLSAKLAMEAAILNALHVLTDSSSATAIV